MSIDTAQQSHGVLLAARDLEDAVAGGEADIVGLQWQLLNAALARETGGVVAGFAASDAPSGEATEEELEDELSSALVELEIGNVLLAGSAVVDTASASTAGAALADAVDNLQAARQLAAPQPQPIVRGLFGGTETLPEDFYTLLPQMVGDVVDRTVGVVNGALGGLAKIPAAHAQPVLTGIASVVPGLSGLAQAGMRAIRRAVDKLTRLVPERMRSVVVEWATQWWGRHGANQVSHAVRSALSVDELDRQIAEDVTQVRAEMQARPADRLRRGSDDLAALADRHTRLTKMIDRIAKALSRVMGPLIALFPPAAASVYITGGSGLLAAVGIAIWVGRDYLDSDVPFARVDGVRTILTATLGR
jgi:hypothetical protein